VPWLQGAYSAHAAQITREPKAAAKREESRGNAYQEDGMGDDVEVHEEEDDPARQVGRRQIFFPTSNTLMKLSMTVTIFVRWNARELGVDRHNHARINNRGNVTDHFQ
jgi:hypothetical protein